MFFPGDEAFTADGPERRKPLGVSEMPPLGMFAAGLVPFAHCMSASLSPSGLRLLP